MGTPDFSIAEHGPVELHFTGRVADVWQIGTKSSLQEDEEKKWHKGTVCKNSN